MWKLDGTVVVAFGRRAEIWLRGADNKNNLAGRLRCKRNHFFKKIVHTVQKKLRSAPVRRLLADAEKIGISNSFSYALVLPVAQSIATTGDEDGSLRKYGGFWRRGLRRAEHQIFFPFTGTFLEMVRPNHGLRVEIVSLSQVPCRTSERKDY